MKQGLGSWAETEVKSQGENTKYKALDQWSVARALALHLCRKEFPPRRKVDKQVRCIYIRKKKIKKNTALVDRHMADSESRAHVVV